MCDRCRVPGCLLDYNGKACKNARKEYCPDVVFTNADHIRSMTDEELGKWIANGISTDPCDYCNVCEVYCDGTPCKGKTDEGIIQKWLKQPYKED